MKDSPVNRGFCELMLRLWHYLGARHRTQFFMLLGLMLISAVAEVVSLGALLPFLGILTAPERVLRYPLIAEGMARWGIVSAQGLVLPITIAFVVAIAVSAAIRMLLLWATTQFTLTAGVELSCETYRKTLYQPYLVHVARNSSGVRNTGSRRSVRRNDVYS